MQWSKVSILTSILLIAALAVNETLLGAAQHQPSVVSDADLFCDAYIKVRDLRGKDVIFLGASRMQTGLDLNTFYRRYPDKKALLLAESGKGSSYPVFRDIVEKTSYQGTIVIDETEKTLTSYNERLSFVKHCYENFSINRQLNRRISTWLQSHLIFLNPQSSSLRLWGNLVSKRKLPVPFYTKTLSDRQQLTDYVRAEPKALRALHDERIKGSQKPFTQTLPTFETWVAKTQHWQPTIAKFQQRGGRVIFVRMPVAQDLWAFEQKMYPPDRYWQPWMSKFNVKSVHFAQYADLSNFRLSDTSHLDMHDKVAFTQAWLAHLQEQLPSLNSSH
jgi:hypothetical protein